MANEDYVLNFSIPLKPEDLEIESETFFYVSDDMDVNSFSTTEIHSLIDGTFYILIGMCDDHCFIRY